MAKNAAKKRRSGTRKIVRKTKNTFLYKKPDIRSAIVKGIWDNALTAEANMARMGLRQSANSDIRPAAARAAARATPGGQLTRGCEVARLFDVPDTDDLKVVDRNFARRPMSDEDQRYTAKLMARFGLDHRAMARDTKINYNQLTLGKLRRMCDTLLSLGDDQRVVTIPERALTAAPGEGGGRGAPAEGSKAAASAVSPAYMDVGDEDEGGPSGDAGEGAGSREGGVKKKSKKKEKKK